MKKGSEKPNGNLPLMQTDGYVTAAKLKDAYLGIGVKQETLLKLFEQHNAEFEKNGYPLRSGKEQSGQLCRIYKSCSMNYIAKIIRIIVIPIVFHILYFNNLQF
ncbi:hypothetical protein [Butyricimonas sp.]|uniref:hypothetical protein n=1 Tax=Butyricimonas sp. TaxID=1969738 RepID=UPI0025BD5905|nr:hypothetical protein [Butyricimonas sp.]